MAGPDNFDKSLGEATGRFRGNSLKQANSERNWDDFIPVPMDLQDGTSHCGNSSCGWKAIDQEQADGEPRVEAGAGVCQ